ncbi:uncharacterized protein LOC110835669 isoform X1 [Zootermopsis nevadensis]|uniref:uncharacterized protein LOC110835669 isoform X1 n=1 Tax=Zootermopsis nevadensis TaxID=136037 RepID=UPI000B8E8658|nr:uncharacterized protein LOC110835669 isoform X1 [Zootermopsis nevadensis]
MAAAPACVHSSMKILPLVLVAVAAVLSVPGKATSAQGDPLRGSAFRDYRGDNVENEDNVPASQLHSIREETMNQDDLQDLEEELEQWEEERLRSLSRYLTHANGGLVGGNDDVRGRGVENIIGHNLERVGGGTVASQSGENIRGGKIVPAFDSNGGENIERGLDSIGGGNLIRGLDSIGGGNVIRGLDSIGGGNVVRNIDSIGGGNLVKGLDSIGGGNVVRSSDAGSG